MTFREDRPLVLVGMMGAGKTTVGQILATRTDRPYVDSDVEVQRETTCTVPELFDRVGEQAFREEESLVLDRALHRQPPVVCSAGGGTVLDPENRRRLAALATVLWLRARPDTLAARVGDGAGRPLLAGDPEAALRRLDQVRRPLYASVADAVVDVDERSPAEVADAALAALGWPAVLREQP